MINNKFAVFYFVDPHLTNRISAVELIHCAFFIVQFLLKIPFIPRGLVALYLNPRSLGVVHSVLAVPSRGCTN